VEVMVAATVLIFGIVTAITTMQRGFQALDTARNLTAAAQLMQSEMERMRLLSWAQLQALQQADNMQQTGNNQTQQSGNIQSQQAGGAAVALDPGMTAPAHFSCTRTITDLKADMKEITLQATWSGYDARAHTARLITRYGKSGLNDYFYTAH
jgi:Na+-transporting NADH:ubiquinone oxidoreductase subunit NqrC